MPEQCSRCPSNEAHIFAVIPDRQFRGSLCEPCFKAINNGEPVKLNMLQRIALMTPEEITKLEWMSVCNALVKAQQTIAELGGGRHSWLDADISLARERSR